MLTQSKTFLVTNALSVSQIQTLKLQDAERIRTLECVVSRTSMNLMRSSQCASLRAAQLYPVKRFRLKTTIGGNFGEGDATSRQKTSEPQKCHK